jgi:hypothetical protein
MNQRQQNIIDDILIFLILASVLWATYFVAYYFKYYVLI